MAEPIERKLRKEYNISVLGEGGVGKSCLSLMYTRGMFYDDYDPTMEDSYQKQTVIDEDTGMLDILDTAAQGEHESNSYHRTRGKDGFLIVYSVTSKASFEKVGAIHKTILRQTEKKVVPLILVGNKSDLLGEREVSTEDGQAMAETLGCKFTETSAKDRVNVDETFTDLVREIRRMDPNYKPPQDPRKGGICAMCAVM
uniref:GTPase n=1 Tax=Dactylellina haptotyla TaxID=430498 RepID=Q5USB3_9PEZI|nr:GTPase [Dactylellina haptotyla]